jgi:hypothetical protein
VSRAAYGKGGSLGRVWAMLLRYLYLLRSSWPRTLELIYWPTLQMLIWGFMSQFLYVNSNYVFRAFGVLLAAVMLWDVLFRGQLGLSISFLEEMWARNLGHLFVTPLRAYEWVASPLSMSLISAVYYPVSILPGWLQHVAWALPSTYVFEGMRTLLFHKVFRADYLVTAAALDIVFLALGAGVFYLSFRGARQRGALLQMGE